MIVTPENALTILQNQGIVALPTETVYGLAALITSKSALESIFITKQRPLFDPLIVHISSLSMAQKFTDSWNDLEMYLVKSFWPGPLTIIKKKKQPHFRFDYSFFAQRRFANAKSPINVKTYQSTTNTSGGT